MEGQIFIYINRKEWDAYRKHVMRHHSIRHELDFLASQTERHYWAKNQKLLRQKILYPNHPRYQVGDDSDSVVSSEYSPSSSSNSVFDGAIPPEIVAMHQNKNPCPLIDQVIEKRNS